MHGWTIPAKSFDAVTLVPYSGGYQNGSSINLDEVMTEHACEVVAVGTSTGDQAAMVLEGSLDGTNWYVMASGGPPPAPSAGTTGIALLAATDQPALYVRASGYSSGSSVVTALLTSG